MLTEQEIYRFLEKHNLPKYRAKQILEAVYKQGIANFSDIKNIPQDLKNLLDKTFSINSLSIIRQAKATDGSVIKDLLQTTDGKKIESVLMNFKDNRHTVCISSQIGCQLGCRFCATGQLKFGRNLETEEIVDQILYIHQGLAQNNQHITNVVYMGMGEPLMNYDNVTESIKILNSPLYFGIGARNITVSTSGIAPKIIALADFPIQVNLAVSLHAPTQQVRQSIMPVAKMHHLDELMTACNHYLIKTNRRITYEYVMLDNINDSLEHAKQLSTLLQDQLCHVNLIPYNATDIPNIKGSPKRKIVAFKKALEDSKIPTTIRVSLGQDINAACGQLANKQ